MMTKLGYESSSKLDRLALDKSGRTEGAEVPSLMHCAAFERMVGGARPGQVNEGSATKWCPGLFVRLDNQCFYLGGQHHHDDFEVFDLLDAAAGPHKVFQAFFNLENVGHLFAPIFATR
jgi:hypothetical protein